jgi:uncharacterized LabA/DUF88 family protein
MIIDPPPTNKEYRMPRRDLRVGVFVDAANVHACAWDKFKRRVDYRKLLEFAVGRHNLYRALVYAVEHGDRMDSWTVSLESFGYEVSSKKPTRYSDGRTKADWDMELAVDVFRMLDSIDMVVIISGDGDFIPLVRLCQSRGKIVRVIGVEDSTNSELKTIVDAYDPISADILMPEREKPVSRPSTRTPETGSSKGFAKDLDITEEERQKLDEEIEASECPFQEPENATVGA